jgi:hypothetical protein
MNDYVHGLKKLIGYFATGIMALLFFGITGWLLLLFVGYSYLQGGSANSDNNTVESSQQTTGYPQQSQIVEGGKLPPEQVTTPIK